MGDDILTKLQIEGKSLSSIQKRAIAFVIDDTLISTLFFIIFYKGFVANIGNYNSFVLFMNSIFVYILIVKIIYQTIFVYIYGQTLGKMAMKIRVVDIDYLDNPSFDKALIRALMRVVSTIFLYLGFLWALYNPKRETWHDYFAKTIVIDD